MTNFTKDNQTLDPYLDELKEQGADLLIRGTTQGKLERARLTQIDAKIEQLTSPVTSGDWTQQSD